MWLTGGCLLLVLAAARAGPDTLLLRGDRLLVLASHISNRVYHSVGRRILPLQIELLSLVQGLRLWLLLLCIKRICYTNTKLTVLESAVLHVDLDALGFHI